MWKSLYDALLQLLTSPWASYLTKFAKQGRLVRDVFFNDIYQYSGIILFAVCSISCLLYYFYFNKRFGIYYKKRTWFIWMFATSFLIGGITFFVGYYSLSSFLCPTTFLVAYLSAINFIYGLILFFILSLICQLASILLRKFFALDLSPMGNRTPF